MKMRMVGWGAFLMLSAAVVTYADSIDDKEALRRGVPVQQIQLEKARVEIEQLKKRVAELEERLANPQTSPIAQSHGQLKYNSKVVSEAWIHQQSVKFSDKITKVGDKFYDVGEDVAWTSLIPTAPLPAGASIVGAGKEVDALYLPGELKVGAMRVLQSRNVVQQAISETEAFIKVDGTIGKVYVSGLDKNSTMTGVKMVGLKVIYTGPYRFGSDRAPQAVPGFAVYHPLTAEEFRECLASGFKLTDYKVEKYTVDVPNSTDVNDGFNVTVHPGTHKVTRSKIIATPVP